VQTLSTRMKEYLDARLCKERLRKTLARFKVAII
jgi:hypothetical protein